VEQKIEMTEVEQLAWAGLVSKGIANSISGLSQMVGQDIKPTALNPQVVEIRDVPDMIGGAETLTVGVYLRVSGDASGHMVLVYKPQAAYELLDMLLGLTPGTTREIDEMAESALGEMGNIMGSFFLNSLADSTGMSFFPSPPAVMMDMAGAILNVALAEIMMETDEACIVEATFGTSDQQVNGTFLVMPSLELLDALREKWGER
jgi:chemotaxis protein CheC